MNSAITTEKYKDNQFNNEVNIYRAMHRRLSSISLQRQKPSQLH